MLSTAPAKSLSLKPKRWTNAFREWLEWYASRNVTRAEIEALFGSIKHVKAGRKFTRDEMNER